MIISVSRRCDIPRFSFGWFLEKLDAGFVDVKNPFNSRQTKKVSLLPPAPGRPPEECAEVFAFWTRDPAAILAGANGLEKRGYGFFVMTTLTSYPALLEPNMPPAGELIKTIRALAELITPQRVVWRYDPVFLSSLTDYGFHRENFSALAKQLAGAVHKVILSVYDEYSGSEKRLSKLEQAGCLKRFPHYASGAPKEKTLLPELRGLIGDLAGIARMEGMEVQCCAEAAMGGACIDGGYIERVFGVRDPGKDRGQSRPGCLCARSVDIGAYEPCPAGCVYCYARPASGP